MKPQHKIRIWILSSITLICLLSLLIPDNVSPKTAYDKFWSQKFSNSTCYNIILAGDSRVYRGLQPAAFDNILSPLTTFNLGYSSAGFSDRLFEQIDKHLLATGKRYVVLGISPHTLTAKGINNEQLEGLIHTPDFDHWKNIYLSQFKNYTEPKDLNIIFNPLLDQKEEFYHENGYVETHIHDSLYTEYAIGIYKKAFADNVFLPSAFSSLINKIQQWQKDDVIVVAYRPPSCAKMVALEDELSGFDEAFIRKKLNEIGVTWIDFNVDNFSSYDASHLDQESVLKVSEVIANRISQQRYSR